MGFVSFGRFAEPPVAEPSMPVDLAAPTTAALATLFVQLWRHDHFDGWPSQSFYIHQMHHTRLDRLRPILPAQLAAVKNYQLWGYLSAALNAIRDQERKAYRARVATWDGWEEES